MNNINIIGIYKITNNKNNHCYIGQSKNIKRRWKLHIALSKKEQNERYNYPLYQAFRKYGIENFSFLIIELCDIDSLNLRELYWIDYYNSEYNQTVKLYHIVPQKLTLLQVKEIQEILINDINGLISHKLLGLKYGVSGKDTIRDINVGRTWYNPKLKYPLHYSKYDAKNPSFFKKKRYYCPDCGKEVTKLNCRCILCSHKLQYKTEHPDRETLKELIRTLPFTTIAKQYNVTDNAVRKWCDKYNLPRKKSEIKQYSDLEWIKI